MKILNIDNYISERIKIKPVTNAELKKAQDEYNKHHIHELRQGDIVYIRQNLDCPYVFIMDEFLYKRVLLKKSLESYDFTKGVILNIDNKSLNFITISDYNTSFKYDFSLIYGDPRDWDIVKIYRGYLNPIYPEDMYQFININNLKKLVEDFKLVFENGKWL